MNSKLILAFGLGSLFLTITPGFAQNWGPRGLDCSIDESYAVNPDPALRDPLAPHMNDVCEALAETGLDQITHGQGYDFNSGTHYYGNSVEIQYLARTYIGSTGKLGYTISGLVLFNDMPGNNNYRVIRGVFDDNFRLLGTANDVDHKDVDPAALRKTICQLDSRFSDGNQEITGFSVADADGSPSRQLTLLFADGTQKNAGVVCTNDYSSQSIQCKADGMNLTVDFSQQHSDIGQWALGFLAALGGMQSPSSAYYTGHISKKDFLFFGPSSDAKCGTGN